MLRTLMIAALLAAAPTALADLPQISNYLGSIGGDLPISMSLGTDRNAHVSGEYVYSQYGKPIGLSGRRTYDKAPRPDFILQEGPAAFELNPANDGTLTGVWKSGDGTRTLPVRLSPAAKTITLVSAKSDRYEIRTAYLQLTAGTPLAKALNARIEKSALSSHNGDLQSFAADTEKEAALGGGPFPYSVDIKPFLLYASDTLVSVRSQSYTYTGGAHGNWGYSAGNYAWVRGALVELTPAMIVPEARWPTLRDLCVKDLTARGASWPRDIKFDKDTPPELNFTSRGLLVAFDPYQAGSYAEGAYIVSLPYAQVRDLIAADGPLGALLPK